MIDGKNLLLMILSLMAISKAIAFCRWKLQGLTPVPSTQHWSNTIQWRIQRFFGQTGTNTEPTLKGTFSKYVPPNTHKQVCKEIKREKQTFARSIMYLNKWTLLLTISSFPSTSFCFIGSSLLPAFLSFKPFWNN